MRNNTHESNVSLSSWPIRADSSLRSGISALAPLVIACIACIVGLILFSGNLKAQTASDLGWPTPPPGPQFTVPSAAQSEISPIKDTSGQGSYSEVIQASWPGGLPLIPPIPSKLITLEDGLLGSSVRLRIDAGSFRQTVQLRMSPDVISAGEPGTYLLDGFDLEAFGVDGDPIFALPQRPIVVTVPVYAATELGVNVNDLLLGLISNGTLRDRDWRICGRGAANYVYLSSEL